MQLYKTLSLKLRKLANISVEMRNTVFCAKQKSLVDSKKRTNFTELFLYHSML